MIKQKNGNVNFTEDGWDSLDFVNLETQSDSENKKDVLYSKAFSTPAGMEVLKDLKTRTVDGQSWYPGVPANFGYVREGQNMIIREILNRIERATTKQ
mgnify:FL=1